MIFVVIGALIIILKSNSQLLISGLRNVSVMMFTLMLFASLRLSRNQVFIILAFFLVGGTGSAAIGIAQAVYGYEQVPTLYSLGLADEAGGERRLAIMDWKFGKISEAGLVGKQVALAVGLNTFTTNFGEMLAYASTVSAAFALYFRQGKLLFIGISAILFTALVLSGSRTSLLIVVAVVFPYLTFTRSPSVVVRSGVTVALVIGALVVAAYTVSEGLLAFDDFGTVSSRNELNADAVSYWLSDIQSFLFGGSAESYYDRNGFSPHNMVLYLLLLFGLAGTIPVVYSIIYCMYLLFIVGRKVASRSRTERMYFHIGVSSTIGFLLYGLTWSIVENANSGLLWATCLGGPLAYLRSSTSWVLSRLIKEPPPKSVLPLSRSYVGAPR
jgi:hypothetical protein